ncbi:MAG TPA: hypothetical protein VEN29_03960 [Casimicrobiaceae bacterium]|nr:hypothetical protein [Casimicrobiaceae bacterium]
MNTTASPLTTSAELTQSHEPLEEYKIVAEFMRQYSTLRFYQLTLLLGTSGTIVTATASAGVTTNFVSAEVLKLGGLITSLTFLAMEYRATSYWHGLRNRANKLARVLRFDLFPPQSRWNPLTSSGAEFYLHVLVALLWIISLLPHLGIGS